MQVKAWGWRRRVNTWRLFKKDLSKQPILESLPAWLEPDQVYVAKNAAVLLDSDPAITIKAKASNVTMNGDFCMSIEVSKAEIKAWAREVIGDETLRELLAEPEAEAQPERVRRRARLRVVA